MTGPVSLRYSDDNNKNTLKRLFTWYDCNYDFWADGLHGIYCSCRNYRPHEICERCFYRCLSVHKGGGVRGRGVCMVGGACMAGGVHGRGDMCDRGCAWQGDGHAWEGDVNNP